MFTARLPPQSHREGFYFRIDLPVPPYRGKASAPPNPTNAPPVTIEPELSFRDPWMAPSSSSHSLPVVPPAPSFDPMDYSLDHSIFELPFDIPTTAAVDQHEMHHGSSDHSNLPTVPAPSQFQSRIVACNPWPANILLPSSSSSSSSVPSTSTSAPTAPVPPEPAAPSSSSKTPTTTPATPSSSSSSQTTSDPNTTSPQTDGYHRTCTHCKTTTTPLWRRGKNPSELLCNACGLYLQARGEYRPQRLIDEDRADLSSELSGVLVVGGGQKQCANCLTDRTTVWRRDPKEGRLLCNACGVYLKMKGRERPVEFRKDKIRRRRYRSGAGERVVNSKEIVLAPA